MPWDLERYTVSHVVSSTFVVLGWRRKILGALCLATGKLVASYSLFVPCELCEASYVCNKCSHLESSGSGVLACDHAMTQLKIDFGTPAVRCAGTACNDPKFITDLARY